MSTEIKSNNKEDKGISLNAKIDDLTEQLNILVGKDKNLKKKKPYKMPAKIKNKLKNIAKKKEILVMYLHTNRSSELMIKKVVDEKILVDGLPRSIAEGTVFLLDGKHPMVVLPSWKMIPIGSKDYEEAVKNKESTNAEKLLIDILERPDVVQSGFNLSNINWKHILIGALVVGVGIYVLFFG